MGRSLLGKADAAGLRRKTSLTDKSTRQPEAPNLMRGFNGIVDKKGILQFATETPIANLGYTQEEVLRKPFWAADWFSPSTKSQKAVKECLSEALEGKSSQCKVEAFTKDGDALPVAFTMSPLKGQDGNIVSIVAEAEEIAESRYPDDFRLSDDRLASILDLAKEAYFQTDGRDTFTMISPWGARRLGYEFPEELLGGKMSRCWASSEQRDIFLMDLSKKGRVEGYKASFLREDGTEVMIELDARLLHNSRGGVIGIEGVFRDVPERKTQFTTEGKQEEDAVGEAEKRYRDIFNSPLQLNFIADLQGRILETNDHAIERTGYTQEEMQKMTYQDFAHPDDIPLALEYLAHYLTGENAPPIESRYITKSGEHI